MKAYLKKLEELARTAVALVKSNPKKRVNSVEINRLVNELDKKISEARAEYHKTRKPNRDFLCIVCEQNHVNPYEGEDTCRWCLKKI